MPQIPQSLLVASPLTITVILVIIFFITGHVIIKYLLIAFAIITVIALYYSGFFAQFIK